MFLNNTISDELYIAFQIKVTKNMCHCTHSYNPMHIEYSSDKFISNLLGEVFTIVIID